MKARLAKHGILFTNTRCQAPIYNPSRTSFILGLRIDHRDLPEQPLVSE